MFTGCAHPVMHCSISLLWLSQHALFLSDTRGSFQIGFVLLVLPAHRCVDSIITVWEDLSRRDLLLFPEWDEDRNEVKCRQSNRFIDHLFKRRHEEI